MKNLTVSALTLSFLYSCSLTGHPDIHNYVNEPTMVVIHAMHFPLRPVPNNKMEMIRLSVNRVVQKITLDGYKHPLAAEYKVELSYLFRGRVPIHLAWDDNFSYTMEDPKFNPIAASISDSVGNKILFVSGVTFQAEPIDFWGKGYPKKFIPGDNLDSIVAHELMHLAGMNEINARIVQFHYFPLRFVD